MPRRLLTFLILGLALPGLAASCFGRGYPDSMAALGDSISQATNACCEPGDYPGSSWSTGDEPSDEVRSHYERLQALHPAITGRSYNFSVSGAKASDLAPQVARAIEQRPEYITLLIGANDLCASSAAAMTTAADFDRYVRDALDTLQAALPGSRIFVSSIPDLHRLWSVLAGNPAAREAWAANGICPAMLGEQTTAAGRRAVIVRQDEFNRILAAACARNANCRWDGGAVRNYRFSPAEISTLDYFHPAPSGQAALADLTWTSLARSGFWGAGAP